jgi:hypothetical protein
MPNDTYFLPRSKGQISDLAFKALNSFARSIGPQWIAGFYYFTMMQVRPTKESEWIDQGAGIGLGSYKRANIPEGYIHQHHGIDYILQIPPQIWEQGKLGIIDVDPTVGGKFIIL